MRVRLAESALLALLFRLAVTAPAARRTATPSRRGLDERDVCVPSSLLCAKMNSELIRTNARRIVNVGQVSGDSRSRSAQVSDSLTLALCLQVTTVKTVVRSAVPTT